MTFAFLYKYEIAHSGDFLLLSPFVFKFRRDLFSGSSIPPKPVIGANKGRFAPFVLITYRPWVPWTPSTCASLSTTFVSTACARNPLCESTLILPLHCATSSAIAQCLPRISRPLILPSFALLCSRHCSCTVSHFSPFPSVGGGAHVLCILGPMDGAFPSCCS